MASPAPAKSQPLHNFSLPHHLTWKKNHNSTSAAGNGAGDQHHHHHHRSRTRISPTPPPPPSFRREIEPEFDFRRQRSPASSFRRHTSSDFIVSAAVSVNESPAPVHSRSDLSVLPSDERKFIQTDPRFSLSNEKRKRSKICVRIKNNLDENSQKDFQVKPITDEGNSGEAAAAAEDEESVPKTWNLRPRRQMNKQSNVNGNVEVHKHGGSLYKELRSDMNNVFPEEIKTVEKKEKKEYSISVSLCRREIEEDIYALTGSKPSRRPKKRSKTVQRQIETLLPGMWLGTINADMYKVSEAPSKFDPNRYTQLRKTTRELLAAEVNELVLLILLLIVLGFVHLILVFIAINLTVIQSDQTI